MKAPTRWFVYTGGNQLANEVVAERLQGQDISREVPCSDGESRSMWECPNYLTIREFERARQKGALFVQIFTRKGRYGKARPWTLGKRRNHTTAKTTSRLQEILARRRKPIV